MVVEHLSKMESSDDWSYLQVHLWHSTARKMTYPLFLCATFYMSGAVCGSLEVKELHLLQKFWTRIRHAETTWTTHWKSNLIRRRPVRTHPITASQQTRWYIRRTQLQLEEFLFFCRTSVRRSSAWRLRGLPSKWRREKLPNISFYSVLVRW